MSYRSVNVSIALGALTVLLVGATVSCSSAPTENRQDAIAAVIVSPEVMTLQLGRKERFQVTIIDLQGEPTNGHQVFWSVQDTTIARIAANGEVEGRALGETQVAASAQGRHDVARLTIIPRQVASVTVSPATADVSVGGTVQLQARAWDSWNDEISGRTFDWHSSNTARATVSSSGLVRGFSPGQVTITAATGGRSGTATVTVIALPVASVTVEPAEVVMFRKQQRQLTARVRDANGAELTGRQVTWSSSDDKLATVSATGVVSSHRRGTVTITATSEGVSGTARVTIL